MSASQANLHEMEQLRNEIAFQKVLLASIDDFVEDRENAEAEVRTEIKTLEKKLRALLKGPSASGSQSMPSHSQNLEPTPSPSNSQKDMTNGDFSTAGSGHKGTFACGLTLPFFTVLQTQRHRSSSSHFHSGR
jgi:uncharacterized coiled-coil protein SlyX